MAGRLSAARIRFAAAAVLACLLALAGCAPTALRLVIDELSSAYDWVPVKTLEASTPLAGQNFGWSVDIGAHYAVVGAPLENTITGAVYVFQRGASDWAFMQKITAPDAAANSGFGYQVCLLDTSTRKLVLVSAILRNSSEGAVYVYELAGGSWTVPSALSAQSGRLTPPEAVYRFGEGLAVTADYIFCGELDAAPEPGKVHIFSTSTFASVQTLTEGAGASNRFGSAITTDTQYLFVAAPYDEDTTGTVIQAGTVYMYKKTLASPPWDFVYSFSDPSPVADQLFGTSLELSGGRLAVGAPGASAAVAHRVLLFEVTGDQASHLQTLASADTGNERYGGQVGLAGQHLVVGDDRFDGIVQDEGKAYLYRETGGTYTPAGTVTRNPALALDYLGSGVAIDGDYLILGISGEGSDNAGQALILEYQRTF